MAFTFTNKSTHSQVLTGIELGCDTIRHLYGKPHDKGVSYRTLQNIGHVDRNCAAGMHLATETLQKMHDTHRDGTILTLLLLQAMLSTLKPTKNCPHWVYTQVLETFSSLLEEQVIHPADLISQLSQGDKKLQDSLNQAYYAFSQGMFPLPNIPAKTQMLCLPWGYQSSQVHIHHKHPSHIPHPRIVTFTTKVSWTDIVPSMQKNQYTILFAPQIDVDLQMFMKRSPCLLWIQTTHIPPPFSASALYLFRNEMVFLPTQGPYNGVAYPTNYPLTEQCYLSVWDKLLYSIRNPLILGGGHALYQMSKSSKLSSCPLFLQHILSYPLSILLENSGLDPSISLQHIDIKQHIGFNVRTHTVDNLLQHNITDTKSMVKDAFTHAWQTASMLLFYDSFLL